MGKFFIGYEDETTLNNPVVFEANDLKDAKEYSYEKIIGPFATEEIAQAAIDEEDYNSDYCGGCRHLGETTCCGEGKSCWESR